MRRRRWAAGTESSRPGGVHTGNVVLCSVDLIGEFLGGSTPESVAVCWVGCTGNVELLLFAIVHLGRAPRLLRQKFHLESLNWFSSRRNLFLGL